MTELKSSIHTSSAIIAIIAFVAMNFIFNILCNREDLRYLDIALLQNGKVFSLISQSERYAKIIMLGSSVMVTPFGFYSEEKGYYDKKNLIVENWFLHNTGQRIEAANLAVEGGMISDQYILLKKYFSKRSAKSILVLGITPRDFLDYRFNQPTETYTFRALVKLIDTDIWPSYIRSTGQFFVFVTDQLSLFYRYRGILSQFVEKNIRVQINLIFKCLNFIPTSNISFQTVMNTNNNLSTVSLSECSPHRLSDQAFLRFEDSVEEYKRIYSNPDNDISYRDQMIFFKSLLILCHRLNISILLINMPISSVNKSLMPPSFYNRFSEEVHSLVCANKINFLDAANGNQFKDNEDFWDTEHLNKIGGAKLSNLMCPLIKKMLEIDSAHALNKGPTK